MIIPDWDPAATKSLVLTAIAGLGGALSYVWKATKAGKKVELFRVALSALMVAFICFHLGFIYAELGLSDPMIWALNGFSSVLGVEILMALASKFLYRWLKVNEDDLVKQKLIDCGWTPPGGAAGRPVAGSPKGE